MQRMTGCATMLSSPHTLSNTALPTSLARRVRKVMMDCKQEGESTMTAHPREMLSKAAV
jgi:hypothetical protein